MAVNLYIVVQNTLVTFVNDFATLADPGFQELTYDTVGIASIKTVGVDPVTQEPSTVRANEVSQTFIEDERRGRTRTRMSDSWLWQLHVKFNRPVDLEGFKDIIKGNLGIARSADNPQVFLDFIDLTIAHPVEVQGSSTGTEFLATIDAKIIRRV